MQLQPATGSKSKAEENKAEKDINFYLPLYKAAIRGNWEIARRFFDLNPDAITATITKNLETVLHVSVGRIETIKFVDELIRLMPTDTLSQRNKFKETALHLAAKYGNVNAAKLLVDRHPGLPNLWNDSDLVPLHLAALFGHKEMLSYLLTVTSDNVQPSPLSDQPGVTLMNIVVTSGFYDVALDLLQRNPKLATTITPGNNTPLSIIAGKPSAFPSGSSLSFGQLLIYHRVPVKLEKVLGLKNGRDIENQSQKPRKKLISVCSHLHSKVWDITGKIVPYVKNIHDRKSMHHQAMELVKRLCREIILEDNLKAAMVFKPAIIQAATLGIYEVVAEILKSFPSAIWSLDREHHDLFQLAVINRRETIFNLLYDLDEHAHLVTQNIDGSDNNILHLAGKLAPPHRLRLVTGAALQMQRELQWYKEVENFVRPSYKAKENSAGKTPAMLFTEEHEDLVSEGEQWLKDTAKSCTFAAVLIATVVFTSAITIPGGNKADDGFPIFYRRGPFIIFAFANSLTLFASTTSVLMFLSILNSRCAEADFLYSLPNKMIIGLVNLFLSISSMMVAFGATIYIVFGHEKSLIIIIMPLVLAACLPITLFISLQYPLLKDMVKSTYGSSIFGKQRYSLLTTKADHAMS